MMTNKARLGLDLGLFVALLVAFFPAATGISVHEWLSLAIFVPTVVHLAVNWDWVVHTLVRFVSRVRTMSRANLIVDIALFVATATVMLSGMMVSQAIASALGVTIVPSVVWHVAHAFSARAVIVLTLAHFALHWRWVLRVARDLFRRVTPDIATRTAVPVRVTRTQTHG